MNYSESSHRERWLFSAAQLVSTSRMTAVHRQVEGKLRYCAELAVGHTERPPCEKHFNYQQGDRPFTSVVTLSRQLSQIVLLGQS